MCLRFWSVASRQVQIECALWSAASIARLTHKPGVPTAGAKFVRYGPPDRRGMPETGANDTLKRIMRDILWVKRRKLTKSKTHAF